jgi:hypothetical protein
LKERVFTTDLDTENNYLLRIGWKTFCKAVVSPDAIKNELHKMVEIISFSIKMKR